MFKTIDECRVELVAHTAMVAPVEEITMLADGGGGKPRPLVDVRLQNCDYVPCSAARASFGNEDKTGEDQLADNKLMRYLADHEHMTPFEYQHAVFLIECPLFIRSQIMRHRTFSFNEISRRYTSENIEFWIPDKFRGQSKSNKQASSDEVITELVPRACYDDPFGQKSYDPFSMWKSNCLISYSEYKHLLESGVTREQARAILPQALITRFYMGGVLRNWQHFIELRRDAHAQYEVQVIAKRIADELAELWPNSVGALGI